MKKVLKWVWLVLEVIIIIYAIFMTLIIFSKNKFGYTQLGKSTRVSVKKSEAENITGSSVNDLLIINKDKKISKGDIIYFYSILDDKYIVKNSKVDSNSSDMYIIENGLSVVESRILGKKEKSIKYVGKLFSLTESKIGFTLLVLLPVFIVFLVQIIELGLILHKDDDIKTNEKEIDKKEIEII